MAILNVTIMTFFYKCRQENKKRKGFMLDIYLIKYDTTIILLAQCSDICSSVHCPILSVRSIVLRFHCSSWSI